MGKLATTRVHTSVLLLLLALSQAEGAPKKNPISFKYYNFTTKIDHFSYRNDVTFQIRYVVGDEHWDRKGGPIFFYAGHEAPVEAFIYNTGLMWEWAPQFKALLVFAEHRYYGKSLPFGADTFKGPEYTAYLSSEQALADYADLLTWLKKNTPGAWKSKVVSFGGSYGALLSTWFRMKYPHIVTAALASSTPLRMFPGLSPCGLYHQAVTTAYEKSSPGCSKIISKTWAVLNEFGSTDAGRKMLQEKFRTCETLDEKTYPDFREWVRDTYTFLALVNYPFPVNLIGSLPAYPVKAACDLLRKGSASNEAMVSSIAQAMHLFYNGTGKSSCNSIYVAVNRPARRFQECTELVRPSCSDGVRDMFYREEWNPEAFIAKCRKRFGVTPDFDKITTTYPTPELQTASNIFFTDGDLDPCYSYGLKKAPNKNTQYVLIKGAAHHVDLQFTRPGQPRSFQNARDAAKKAIRRWIS